MDWLQVLAIVGSTIGCCLYFRKETKEQINKLADHGRERDQENKDFHARMCVLEERYFNMMKTQEEIRTLLLQQALEKK